MYNVCCVSCHGGWATPKSGWEVPCQSQSWPSQPETERLWPVCQARGSRVPPTGTCEGLGQGPAVGGGQLAKQLTDMWALPSRAGAMPCPGTGPGTGRLPFLHDPLCAGVWDQKGRWAGGQAASAPPLGQTPDPGREGSEQANTGVPQVVLASEPVGMGKPHHRALCAPGPAQPLFEAPAAHLPSFSSGLHRCRERSGPGVGGRPRQPRPGATALHRCSEAQSADRGPGRPPAM